MRGGGMFVIALIAIALSSDAAAPALSAADPSACRASDDIAATQVIADCDAALTRAADPATRSRQFFARAYAKNALQRFEEALPDLDEAIRLDATNASAFHERAYTRSSLMQYADALADLDTEAKLRPNSPKIDQEQAFSHGHLGQFQAAFDDLTRYVVAVPDDSGALIGRAQAALWLGRFDQARADLSAAAVIAGRRRDAALSTEIEAVRHRVDLMTASGPAPEKACKEAGRTLAFTSDHLIGDCTVTFLNAKTVADRVDALVVRSEAWTIGQQDPKTAVLDTEMMAALDPGNADWHSNLGFGYMTIRRSWAAMKEFDRSIEIKPSFVAYAGRASARYNLGDADGAVVDAKKSFEMKPNEIALTVLGDVALEKLHDPKAARDYWLGAYHLGDRDDGLVGRLKRVGVEHPEKEPASP